MSTDKEYIYIICTYERLETSRASLPTFLHFRPNNVVVIKLNSDIINKDSKKNIMSLLNNWFFKLSERHITVSNSDYLCSDTFKNLLATI